MVVLSIAHDSPDWSKTIGEVVIINGYNFFKYDSLTRKENEYTIL